MSRIAVTDTPVTIALLSAYCPRLPTSQASTQRERSIDVGSANGAEKMAGFVLKLDRTIQTIGKKNAPRAGPGRRP